MSAPKPPSSNLISDLTHVARGLCMGCADVVPGVSGGTVALILGIYERLVTAISRVDGHLFQLCRERRWLDAVAYLDLRFLVALGIGVFTGIVMMSLMINRLLTSPTSRSLTLAAFFGMILASAVLLCRLVKPDSTPQRVRVCLAGLLAVAFSVWVARLQSGGEAGDPAYWWIFVCGAIAICAMILPGISGAMILLVLGVYVHLTEVPRNLLAGEHLQTSILTLIVFGSGCAISLVLFSKVLRFLLGTYHAATMAVLCGLMIGALIKLWPFQRDLTPEIEEFKHKHFEMYFPAQVDGMTTAVITAAVLAMVLVFAADFLVRRRPSTANANPESASQSSENA